MCALHVYTGLTENSLSSLIDVHVSIMEQQYQKRVNKDLASQKWSGLFQRNVVASLEDLFSCMLEELQSLPFPDKDKSQMRHYLHDRFKLTIDEFIFFVVNMHRNSCAISNFPPEHKPEQSYVDNVKQLALASLDRFLGEFDELLLVDREV